ncbi:dipicolinate synthase subunit DpsA [Niameybacter massiliensis]|uniref:dipicolinate synthase subunit DpsA n=1 Tax=Niameybacter massiliensis TaxID=1658108 RepID=UPI0006B4D5BD|nr:dipicolinate synthase subunit DpsA [Niameybacter massiliensis]
MSIISIAIVGGDLRFVRLAKILCDKGFDTWVYGITHPDLPKNVHLATSLEDISKCQYIVGPIPFTRDGKNLFTPLSNTSISVEMFMENVKDSFLCLSVLKKDIIKLLEERNLRYKDLLSMDEVAVLNAIPTAEGAIQYAMENSEITLNDSKCLVLGFGRCGKILAQKLHGIGARVYVEARKTLDLAFIASYDYVPVPLDELKKHLWKFDFIFNTIPVPFLDPSYIDLFKKEAVYIELASTPGGIDIPYCEQTGVHYVPAPSLPGIIKVHNFYSH